MAGRPAKGFQNLVMFTLGTGVGGGIILNGRIISRRQWCGAGEIGHMVIVDSDECCGNLRMRVIRAALNRSACDEYCESYRKETGRMQS